MRLPVNRLAAVSLVATLTSCAGSGGVSPQQQSARLPASGPAADYPMVLGSPFVVDGVAYTPADTLNYDQVGYAAVGAEGGAGISLAHRVLPLPSYVEVTSLITGKTILARVERRGPMTSGNLIELSPGAALQLGVTGNRAPVRVRRVNPPEAERALLRTAQRAPDRMDTPMPLVSVLLRKLDPAATAPPVPAPTAAPAEAALALPVKPTTSRPEPYTPVAARPHPAPKPRVKPAAKPTTSPTAAPAGKIVVQVGAFSSAARAAEVARNVGGQVVPAGKLYRVRIGVFTAPAAAHGALAKARGAGYSDARIQRAD